MALLSRTAEDNRGIEFGRSCSQLLEKLWANTNQAWANAKISITCINPQFLAETEVSLRGVAYEFSSTGITSGLFVMSLLNYASLGLRKEAILVILLIDVQGCYLISLLSSSKFTFPALTSG